MAFLAGDVTAILGAKVNPAGFVAYDAAVKKAAGSAAAAEKAAAAAGAAMGRSGTAAGAAAGAHAKFGAGAKAAAAGGLAVGAALIKSVAAAASFETRMSELQAVTKASGKDMKRFADIAKDLGVKTGVGATAAAEALTELAKGGMSVSDILGGGFQGTLALAQAGTMDLAAAGVAVTKTLAQFNLKGTDATHVADALASAANATSMDVSDFTQALAQGGAAAQAAGLSFDDTINVMAAMADRFQSGSDLGTSLKTTLTQLASPTAKAKEEMKRLGIEAFDSNGKIKTAAELTKLLGDKFSEMTPKQRLASAALIAGTDGMRTLIALSQGAATNVIRNGAAAETAAKKTDNLAGAWNRFKASLQGIAIDLGGPLLRPLADGLDAVRGALKAIGPNGIKAALAGVAGFAVARTVAPGVMALARAFQAYRAAAAGASVASGLSAVAAMVNPVTAAAVAVGALSAGLVLLSGRESAAEQAARRHAQALRDLQSALDELEGKTVDDAAAAADAADRDREAADARRDYQQAVEKFGKTSPQAKEAHRQLRDATIASTKADIRAREEVRDRIKTSEEAIKTARKEQAAARERVRDLTARTVTPGGKGLAPANASAQAQAGSKPQAQRELAEANRQLAKANAEVALSELNKQRLLGGSTPIARRQAMEISGLKGQLKDLPKDVRTRILTEGTPKALGQLAQIMQAVKGTPKEKQILTILRGDGPVKLKLAAVAALAAGVPNADVQTILHGDGTAKQRLNQLAAAARGVPNAVPISVQVATGGAFAELDALARRLKNLGTGRAAGRGPDGSELALVGEGRNPREAVVSPGGGWAMVTNGPTLMGLPADAYVIPEDPQYRGRAMGFLEMLAGDLGLRGFKKGKKPAAKKSAGGGAQSLGLPDPGKLTPTVLPLADLEEKTSTAERRRDDAKTRLDRLTDESREKRDGKPTKKALQAKRKLKAAEKDKRDTQRELDRLRKQLAQARKYQAAIEKAETLADVARQDMQNANARGDRSGWDSARGRRGAALKVIRGLLEKAQQVLGDKNSQAAAELAQKIADNDGEQLELESGAFDLPADEAFTPDDERRLAELDRDIALAALTEGLGDDTAAAQAKEQFLSGLLSQAQTAGRSADVIRDLAEAVGQARDNVRSLTTGGSVNDNVDLQAQIEQANRRAQVAEDSAKASADVLRAFRSSGDIGTGGGSAAQVVFQSYVPPSPSEALRLAGYVTGGLSYQGAVQSPRQTVGL